MNLNRKDRKYKIAFLLQEPMPFSQQNNLLWRKNLKKKAALGFVERQDIDILNN